jgi:ATP adenylyltransferase
MEYILRDRPVTPAGRPAPEALGCVFCDFAASPRGALREKLVLLVQPHALVCLNKYPFTTSHLLVIPRRHTADLSELPAEEYDALMRLLRDACARLRRVTSPHGLNVGMNLGAAAGAGIAEHLHWHVVPRWNGDTNFMPVVADVRIMPEYLDASWQKLEPAFADLPGDRWEAPPDTDEAPHARQRTEPDTDDLPGPGGARSPSGAGDGGR